MKIDETTTDSETNSSFRSPLGEYVLVRTYASGVHAGVLVQHDGRQVELKDARRLWRWKAKAGISLSDVSQYGVDVEHSKSKICASVPRHFITDALELMPMAGDARDSIVSAAVYMR